MRLHPFAPAAQWKGYRQIITDLESWLSEITGFAATCLQPNSGAQGEYAGLLSIRAYHADRQQTHRDVMLIPISAPRPNSKPSANRVDALTITELESTSRRNRRARA